jgi:dTDP-4-amino-4,6-dideoxygalactose transaminase
MANTLKSGLLSRGKNMVEFEEEMAAYLGKKHALFTGNGTQAQMLLLRSLGIGEGDEVILPTYVCDKVWKGIEAVGAQPVLCDVDSKGCMTADEISRKITPNTKAIILVHIFGINSWSDGLAQLNIPIIEDICQSFGSLYADQKTGTFTSYAFTSFHGTKAMGLGEGGMLFTDDTALFERIIQLKSELGFITSGTDIIAALGVSQLQRYDEGLMRRKEIAASYFEKIDSVLNSWIAEIRDRSMFFRYVLKSQGEWEHIRESYLEYGVHVRKGVDSLLHRQYGFSDVEFPNATQLFEQAVSIPILPQLTDEQVNSIIEITHDLKEKRIL